MILTWRQVPSRILHPLRLVVSIHLSGVMYRSTFHFCGIGQRYAAPEAFRYFLFPLQVFGDGKAGWNYFYRCIILTLLLLELARLCATSGMYAFYVIYQAVFCSLTCKSRQGLSFNKSANL